jgi:FdrA protein
VLRRLGREVPTWPVTGTAAANPGLIRGLFVGGTLAGEARLIVEEALGAGAGHTFVDFGEDEYTTGRAHPMIDPTLRLEHLARAAADPETGVLLLDVVLGHGADPDPAATLAPALTGIGKPVVVAVVGTASDPQGLERQVAALAGAGAEVHLSNAGATRRAIELIGADA